MSEEMERFCAHCGAALKEGASFCVNCGAAVSVAPESAAVLPPQPPGPPPAGPQGIPTPPYGPPPNPPGVAEAGMGATWEPEASGVPGVPPIPPPKRGKLPLVAGICGGLLIVAGVVVLVLFLTVWKSSGGGAGDPLALAEKYVSAMEKGDVEAYFDCFPPEYFSMQDNPLLEGMDIDIKGLLKTAFNMMDVKFKNLKLELESEKGDQASVVSTSGTLVIAVMGVEQEADLAEDPLQFEMVKQDGRWYLTNDPMPTAWGQEFNFNMD